MVRVPGLEDFPPEYIPGTPAYMAPEMFAGEPGTVATDIYALGVTLFRTFTGAFPYANPDATSMPRLERPRDIATLRPDLPAWLQATLSRAIAADPAERFPTWPNSPPSSRKGRHTCPCRRAGCRRSMNARRFGSGKRSPDFSALHWGRHCCGDRWQRSSFPRANITRDVFCLTARRTRFLRKFHGRNSRRWAKKRGFPSSWGQTASRCRLCERTC